jgi:molecular chaperone GrpE (heat shock protein)
MILRIQRRNDLPKQQRNEGAGAGERPHSLACLSTFVAAPLLFFQYVYGQLVVVGRKAEALDRRLEHLTATIVQQNQDCDRYITTLAACQKETAALLNREIERRDLYPAVEALVALATELSRLDGQVQQWPAEGAAGDQVNKLRQELALSCSIASEKLAHLEITMIAPGEKENFDPQIHSVCGFVATDDKRLHKKIAKLLTPGIRYQGKVLQPARVSVLRLQVSQ